MRKSSFSPKNPQCCIECEAFKICRHVERVSTINGEFEFKTESLPFNCEIIYDCDLVGQQDKTDNYYPCDLCIEDDSPTDCEYYNTPQSKIADTLAANYPITCPNAVKLLVSIEEGKEPWKLMD